MKHLSNQGYSEKGKHIYKFDSPRLFFWSGSGWSAVQL